MKEPRYQVSLIEKKNAHYYRVAGVDLLFPGVTTVLSHVLPKPWLAPWAAKEAANRIKRYLKANAVNRPLTADEIDEFVEEGRKEHEKKRDEAADLGTRAHRAIDQYIMGETAEVTEDIRPAVEAFHAWQDAHPFRLLMGDTKVASVKERFGGSLDILGESKDGIGIIDLKTSNQISWDYALQVAGYAMAFEETYDQPIKWAMILRVSKTKPEFEARPIKDLEQAKHCFQKALELYRVKDSDLL